ncbi:MAG: GNVR domain-containing protein [bacterium]|nr:GNVR domain-containing protein [bacterium]
MNFEETGGLSLNDVKILVLRSFRRYFRISVWPGLALVCIGLAVSLKVPNFYSSDALIYVQPQRLSSAVVDSPNDNEMSERMEALVQTILSRPRLKKIVQKYELYPEYRGTSREQQSVIKLRQDIGITPVTSTTGSKLNQTFRLSFSYRDKDKTYEVLKDITDLFIEESLLDKRTEIKGTEDWLDAELTEARQKLESTEASVQAFVRDNFEKLPQHLEAALGRLEGAQKQLANNSQLIAANMTRKATLEAELSDISRSPGVSIGQGSDQMVSPEDGLAQLESALLVLLSRYSERHPDVVATKKRIEALKQQISSSGGGAKVAPVSQGKSSTQRTFKLQLGELEAQIVALNKENETLRSDIKKLQANIDQMPVKEQELLKIKRDYANVKANYEKLLSAREDAGLKSSLVRSQRSAQFRVVDPPERPIRPSGPNRPLFVIAACVFGFIVAMALPVGFYFLNNGYKTVEEMQKETGLTVIGVVPPMETPFTKAVRRKFSLISAALSGIGAVTGVIVVLVMI